jgi:hypothetical protein
MTEYAQLSEIIARIIDSRRDEARISPSWTATEAMKELDPERRSPPLVYLGCHLQLRQIARHHLRQEFQPEGEIQPTAQDDLFPHLQWRYPTARSRSDDEPEYVLRERMSDDDVVFNIKRLRREGASKLKQADALEEWWEGRQKTA